MQEEKPIAVYGMGPDQKGLVGRLAGAIAGLGGNIVDLTQNVTHGLFSVFLLTDLSASKKTVEDLRAAVDTVAAETGLTLHVGRFEQTPRPAERKGMLLILLGPDKPGLIASMAQTLGHYGINIEMSRNVSREGVFLMELVTDIAQSTLPEPNIRKTLTDLMTERGIRTMFQFTDVFNKKKRVIVFSLSKSLLDPSTLSEIVRQTGLNAKSIAMPASEDDAAARSASLLEGCSADLLEKVAASFSPTNETIELVQELKILGYRVAVVTSGFSFFADRLKSLVGADYTWGVPLNVDADTRTVSGSLDSAEGIETQKKRFVSELVSAEKTPAEDVVVLDDSPAHFPGAAGIRLDFDLRFLLDAFNRKALSREALTGILCSFGRLPGGKIS
jgi:phosphoserine phosphatase